MLRNRALFAGFALLTGAAESKDPLKSKGLHRAAGPAPGPRVDFKRAPDVAGEDDRIRRGGPLCDGAV